ncbi:MAG: exosortase/archaeosortase family protein [Candidatus ainarchaeum sp.]|nr:exosortase/archaeosortase family protein [Candidatus ainarchaeum sp.]
MKKNNLKNNREKIIRKKKFETEISQLKNFFSKQEEKILSSTKKQFSFFILIFIFFYLFFSITISPFENNLKEFTGNTSETLLKLQGINITEKGMYETTGNEMVYSFFINEKQIIISWLCTGILEIIILISTILATLGIAWKQKIIGIIAGIFSGLVFNFIRIWITINIILTQETSIIEFSHDFLFRAILFVYIIGFYVTWFYFSNTTNKSKKQINQKNKY